MDWIQTLKKIDLMGTKTSKKLNCDCRISNSNVKCLKTPSTTSLIGEESGPKSPSEGQALCAALPEPRLVLESCSHLNKQSPANLNYCTWGEKNLLFTLFAYGHRTSENIVRERF